MPATVQNLPRAGKPKASRGARRNPQSSPSQDVGAPVSVLVHPIRAMRVFGLEKGGNFAEKVVYIYNKQLEAAPHVLGTAVREGLAAVAGRFATLEATLDHLEHFRPEKPTPTHRFRRVAA